MKMKRFLSTLLAVVLLLSLAPALDLSALAIDEPDSISIVPVGDPSQFGYQDITILGGTELTLSPNLDTSLQQATLPSSYDSRTKTNSSGKI